MKKCAILLTFLLCFTISRALPKGVTDIHWSNENVYKKQSKFLKKNKREWSRYQAWARKNRKSIISEELPTTAYKS
ncbi:MAG: hypothetical protein KDC83_07070 [Flavobacteriales bacterium]|nr:hypothetical protein [Flavobacteriales bacterium]